MTHQTTHRQDQDKRRPEDDAEQPGTQGGSSGAEDAQAPFEPDETDDSPLGDSDQHSSG